MKRLFLAAVIAMPFLFCAGSGHCEEKGLKDPNQLFFKANASYETGDYAKALESYNAILDSGLETGTLYYNIGNSYLKLGKIGYAILYYEKAKRLIPQDGDLRSNLAYARSFTGDSGVEAPPASIFLRAVKKPFKDFNLNAIAVSALALYLIVIASAAVFIVRPLFAKRYMLIFVAFLALLVLSVGTFGLRYYDEDALRRGVVVAKDLESRYEPIDKSTIYYTLHEGSDVLILKTRDGWRQIRRADGKIGWVKAESIGEV